MSLNGLDDPKVKAAYDSAAAEAGGWFFLKYASRDEVELLGSGAGGVAEMRNAVGEYEDASPLYGFLRYRRRNVLIKYLPEGCSRLVQARMAVHFNAICERFSPYDVQYDISTAEEIRDSKLSAACSLHAASGSNSSTASSQRKKHLMEIAEEDEDEQPNSKRQSLIRDEPKSDETDRPKTALTTTETVKLDANLAESPEQTKFAADTTSDLPHFIGASDFPDQGRRMSSQSGRAESLFTPYSSGSYAFMKPRVKLAARPSLDAATIRPQTAGNFRPVSSIPAGLKLFGKGSSSASSQRGKSRRDLVGTPDLEISEMSFAATLSIPEEPGRVSELRPATSSGVSTKSAIMGKPAMTPEKMRLKKAMQLREKRKKGLGIPPVPALDTSAAQTETPAETAKDETFEKSVLKPDVGKLTIETPPEQRTSVIKADSAIEIDASPSSTKASLIGRDSEEAERSTKASSIAETTEPTTLIEEEKVTPVMVVVEPKAESPVDITSPDEARASEAIMAEVTQTEVVEQEPVAIAEEDTKSSSDKVNTSDEVDTPAQTKAPVEASAEEGAAQELPLEPADEPKEIPSAEDKTYLPTAETISPADIVALSEAAPQAAEVKIEELPRESHAETTSQPSEEATTQQVSEPVEEEAMLLLAPLTYRKDSTLAEESFTDSILELEPTHIDEKQSTSEEVTTLEAAQKEAVGMPAAIEKPPTNTTEIDVPEPAAATSDDLEVTAPAEVETSPSIPKLRIPKSKFSQHDLRATAAAQEEVPAVPSHNSPSITEPNTSPRPRRGFVEPIRTNIPQRSRPTSGQHTETNFSDDEDLMDELQSATVEEAMPMSVVKTPVTPVFPLNIMNASSGAGGAKPAMIRTVSNPVRGNLIAPPTDVSQSYARSVSQGGAVYLHKVTQQAGKNALAKKAGVGSSISQRIKALELLSVHSAEASPANARPSSSFFSVKKGREPSRSPSLADRKNSYFKDSPEMPSTTHSRVVSREQSREPSPATTSQEFRERSGSVASRLTRFESSGSPGSPNRGRPESVSVTAKIIRDGSDGKTPQHPSNPSEYTPIHLKQSPLTVDHQVALDTPEVVEPPKSRRTSKDTSRSGSQDGNKSRRPSMGMVKEFINNRRQSLTSPSLDNLSAPFTTRSGARSPNRPPSVHQTSSFSNRLSISSRRSLSKDRESIVSPITNDDDDRTSTSDKRTSRAGRLMRRLSSLSGTRSKISTPPGISPTVAEEDPIVEAVVPATPIRPATTAGEPSITSHMGDVNVQFPDTLLWKRRNMCLDSQGFLILSALATGGNRTLLSSGVKRFHLSDFTQPYAPDVEIQEMPNSVRLDLKEGSGVQVACEDRAGQKRVLQILLEAHSAHASRFGH